MKIIVRPFLLAVVSITAAFGLSSCVIYDDGGGYSNQGAYPAAVRAPSNYGYRSSGPVYQDQRRFPYSNGGFNQYRNSSYRDPHYGHGRQDDRNDRYDRNDHGHDAHHQSNNGHSDKKQNLSHHPNSYRIAGGSTGSKTKPKGYHSVSWYKSRGYDVNKLSLKNEKGKTYKKKR